MPPTQIESFLFRGDTNHLVIGCEFGHGNLRIKFRPLDKAKVVEAEFGAVFPQAVITALDQHQIEWPLVVIGLDAYRIGERWLFVLECGTVEWVWESKWPHIVHTDR